MGLRVHSGVILETTEVKSVAQFAQVAVVRIGWKSTSEEFYSRDEGSTRVASKSKRTASGILSCAEKASRFSNEGALIPRSMRLKKSTDIPSSSANCSWLNFLANLIALRRWPNFSRKVGT